nr:hypothetical protein [Burkholderia gladioli]
MAVAETTTAEGKSASGEARRVKRSSGMRAAAVLATSRWPVLCRRRSRRK